MPQQDVDLLSNSVVCAALKQAWLDSQPGIVGGHEEGGFILRDLGGSLSVARWPQGVQNSISLPLHPGCKVGSCDVVATFHTHPNTGDMYLQEPSETDRRAVQEDPDLQGPLYAGEFVITQERIYLITSDGQVSEVGETRKTFAQR